MIRSSEPAPILLSGASATPRRRLQRLRARMMLRKRLTLSATAAGGLPARTCSKWRVASLSSSLRKKARASSSRTRTRPGSPISILRKAAMAASSSASRDLPDTPGCWDASIAARPMRKSAFAGIGCCLASGWRTVNAFRYCRSLISTRAFAIPAAVEWLAAGAVGGWLLSLHAGAERNRTVAPASTPRIGRIGTIRSSPKPHRSEATHRFVAFRNVRVRALEKGRAAQGRPSDRTGSGPFRTTSPCAWRRPRRRARQRSGPRSRRRCPLGARR